MNRTKTIWGLYFIMVSILLILSGMDFIWGISVMKLLVLLLLLPIFVYGILKRDFARIIFPPAIAAALFRTELGIEELSLWLIIFSALIMSIGFNMIFHKKHKSEEPISIDNPDNPVISAKFNSVTKYFDSDNLTSTDVNVHFGNAILYFDKTFLNPDGAVIQMNVYFSNVELYIPKSWKVIDNVKATLSDFHCGDNAAAADAPVLCLQGNAAFSAIELVYV